MQKYYIPKIRKVEYHDSEWTLLDSPSDSEQKIKDIIINGRNYTLNGYISSGSGTCAQGLREGMPHSNFMDSYPKAVIRALVPYRNYSYTLEELNQMFSSWMRFLGNMGLHFEYELNKKVYSRRAQIDVESIVYYIPINHPVFGRLDQDNATGKVLALHAIVRYIYTQKYNDIALDAMEIKNNNPDLPEWVCLEMATLKPVNLRGYNGINGLNPLLCLYKYNSSGSENRERVRMRGYGTMSILAFNPIHIIKTLSARRNTTTYQTYSKLVAITHNNEIELKLFDLIQEQKIDEAYKIEKELVLNSIKSTLNNNNA